MQKTNVIYLTTRCNLECEYCYESHKRNQPEFEHFNLTKQQIDDLIKKLEETEPNAVSTMTVMGGEPTLAWEEMDYLATAMVKSKMSGNKPGGYAGSFTTNGIWLAKPENRTKMKNLMRWLQIKHGISFELEISYDGKGQTLRVFPNGKETRELVENVMDSLKTEEIPFCISYTITERNYLSVIHDFIYIMERWKPHSLDPSWAFQRLHDKLGIDIRESIPVYNKKFGELMKHYRVTICGINMCGICKACDNQNFTGNRYLSPTKDIMEKAKETKGAFDQF